MGMCWVGFCFSYFVIMFVFVVSDSFCVCLTQFTLYIDLFLCGSSILGMNLFGCKFCYETPEGVKKCDRKNFDSLLWAIITVFQVELKLENAHDPRVVHSSLPCNEHPLHACISIYIFVHGHLVAQVCAAVHCNTLVSRCAECGGTCNG